VAVVITSDEVGVCTKLRTCKFLPRKYLYISNFMRNKLQRNRFLRGCPDVVQSSQHGRSWKLVLSWEYYSSPNNEQKVKFLLT